MRDIHVLYVYVIVFVTYESDGCTHINVFRVSYIRIIQSYMCLTLNVFVLLSLYYLSKDILNITLPV